MNKVLYLLMLSLTQIGLSQNYKIEKINTQNIDAKVFWGVDTFSNIYGSTQNNIYKFIDNKSFQYNNWNLGKPTDIDILNPLKIVVFYEKFNTIILLDNQLNEIKKINLSEIKTPIIASEVSNAASNMLWIYDQSTQQLGTLDLTTLIWKKIGTPFQNSIKKIASNYNFFYFRNTKDEIYRCDRFGVLKLIGNCDTSNQIYFLSDNKIMYSYQSEIFLKNLDSNNIEKIKINEKTFESFYYKDQILSIFTNQQISNYKIIIP